MKVNKQYLVFCILLSALAVFSTQAFGQGDMTMLIQVSPPGAGIVTPGEGVHQFSAGSQVSLNATANEGYQFVHWLGDVLEPGKINTLSILDTPKILIAVFERSTFEFSIFEQPSQASIGAGSAIPSTPIIGGNRGGGLIRRGRSSRFIPRRPDNGEEEEPEFPVPDEPEDFPVPEIPEPASGGMFLLGTLMVIMRRKKRRQAQQGTV